ncbi:GNAT family N-acetyltransferase, partial [Streptococcus agalactiae]|nr:GNAT family N-acetyltransferase [Streptococcus agalactiae]
LRVSVFVVEQDCPYQEVDDKDLICLHGMNWVDGQLAAYYRLIPEDDKVHLGRVIVNPDFRKKGLGNQLVEHAIKFSEANYPNKPIYAQAQAYLQDFYQSFGFQPVSEIYLEDNIP